MRRSDQAGGVGFGVWGMVGGPDAKDVLVNEADGREAELVGVAFRVEFGLDVRALGPRAGFAAVHLLAK